MGNRVDGRTILVTGAASGIGAAIARGCADEGANVVIADLNLKGAEAIAGAIESAGGSAIVVGIDVVDRASIVAAIEVAVERFGRLDVYFNNAGMNAPMKFVDITEANFERVMSINALGVLIGTQEAARQYLKQGAAPDAVAGAVIGKVVNTASIAGRTGFPNFAPYSASKAAVISLTQAAARSFAAEGITVNAFAPGVVATPLWTQLDKDLADIGAADAGFDSMASDILLGRPAQPSDIVPTALFLASSDSDYITGQVIPIEGGMILV
jgi:meso-butanediol dehydrogenase/(S,S)-butanediol dehydrogenase/diacetyl reductase